MTFLDRPDMTCDHGEIDATVCDRCNAPPDLENLQRGAADLVADFDDLPDGFEGPTCSICDALGHGYPGAGPCPLEVADYSDEPWWAQ